MSTNPPYKIIRDYRETREAMRRNGFRFPGGFSGTGIPGKKRAAGFPPCRPQRGRRE